MARRAGRDPLQVDVACLVLASAGDASSERLCRERIANYLLLPFYQNLLRLSGFGADVDRAVAALKEGDTQKGSRAISDRMLDALAFSGVPATWWPKVMKLDKAGVSLVCPFLFPSGRDARESLLRGIEGLAQARRAHEGR